MIPDSRSANEETMRKNNLSADPADRPSSLRQNLSGIKMENILSFQPDSQLLLEIE